MGARGITILVTYRAFDLCGVLLKLRLLIDSGMLGGCCGGCTKHRCDSLLFPQRSKLTLLFHQLFLDGECSCPGLLYFHVLLKESLFGFCVFVQEGVFRMDSKYLCLGMVLQTGFLDLRLSQVLQHLGFCSVLNVDLMQAAFSNAFDDFSLCIMLHALSLQSCVGSHSCRCICFFDSTLNIFFKLFSAEPNMHHVLLLVDADGRALAGAGGFRRGCGARRPRWSSGRPGKLTCILIRGCQGATFLSAG